MILKSPKILSLPIWGAACFALAEPACRHGSEAAPIDAAVAPTAVVDAAPKPTPPPAAYSGVFHLMGGQPAVNLLLADDGTFVWSYEDCVCAGGGWGTWQLEGASVVLRRPPTPRPRAKNEPPTNDDVLRWATLVALDGGRQTVDRKPAPDDVSRVTLTASASGLVADVAWSRGGTQSQRWSPGHVCPVCRPMFPGPLPTGADAVACDQPMLMMHRGPGLACH